MDTLDRVASSRSRCSMNSARSAYMKKRLQYAIELYISWLCTRSLQEGMLAKYIGMWVCVAQRVLKFMTTPEVGKLARLFLYNCWCISYVWVCVAQRVLKFMITPEVGKCDRSFTTVSVLASLIVSPVNWLYQWNLWLCSMNVNR